MGYDPPLRRAEEPLARRHAACRDATSAGSRRLGRMGAPPLRRPLEAGAVLDRPGRPRPRRLLALVRSGRAVPPLLPRLTNAFELAVLRYRGSPRRPSRPSPGPG